jgi:hypothetical protein
MLKRALQAAALGYVVLGIATRVMEEAGVYTCTCTPDCWCKRPGVSLFRWVVPRWHKE